jgi:hypothetical protein
MNNDINKHIGTLEDADKLLEKLNQKTFLKSQIDCVYSDYINWERAGILMTHSDKLRGTKNEISYIEYIWASIVKQLRKFGYSYDEIKVVKSELIDQNMQPEMVKTYNNQNEFHEKLKKTGIDENILDYSINTSMDIFISQLEVLVYSSILNNDNTKLIFNSSSELPVIIISNETIENYKKQGIMEEVDELIDNHHISISLSKILEPIVKLTKEKEIVISSEILTEPERKLLSNIRKDKDSIKEITIKFKVGEIDRLDITQTKKVELESKILQMIKTKEYVDIQYKKEKGKIVYCILTEKIKI